ncbi:MAG: hypothetical protein AUH39_00170 [Chloroflexi bacterium 13_1_40CM_67_9]|nr:MAG: hypothetical protein AUH39_00170 [Chloroflexi bacterium 13_1_40CM_67_9]
MTFVGRVESTPGLVSHQVLLRDRANGTTTPISLTPDGSAAINAGAPRVSADGRYVVFEAGDDRLDPAGGPLFGSSNTFLRDVLAGTTTRISRSGPEPTSTIQGRNPKISADGRWITFENGAIFLYDRINRTTDIVARTPSGSYAFASDAAISDDGRFIAYSSRFVMGVPNGQSDIFVYDRVAGTTTRASLASDGTVANRDSFIPAISGDGRFVAFQSTATNLDTSVPDTNGSSDIFVRDLVAGTTRIASITSAGTTPNRESFEESISLDGTKVTFTSRGTDVLPGDTNNAQDVFMRDFAFGANAAPAVFVGSDATSTLGGLFTRDGSFVDGDANQTWSATVDYGDGPPTPLALRADKTFTLSHTYTAFATYLVHVVVTDSAGGIGESSFHITVGNFRPVVNAGGQAPLNEGDHFVRTGSFTDPDLGQTWTATVNYGDGPTVPLALGSDKTYVLDHAYETGTYTIVVTVSDGIGEPGIGSVPVTALNLAPQVTVEQLITAYVETKFHLAGTFTDPGQAETYQGSVDFGDGTAPEPLDISGHAFTVTHRFAAIGSYTGIVTLRDSNDGSRRVTLVVAVLRRPLIFIPGTLGSVLRAADFQLEPIPNGHGGVSIWPIRPGDELWPDRIDVVKPGSQDEFDRLKFKPEGPPYVRAEVGGLLPGAYDPLFAELRAAGYVDGATLYPFPYDWRYSAGSPRNVTDLDALIVNVMARTHADSVDILAHSMGTMVTRAYLTHGTHATNVTHAVLLGSPQLGATDTLALALYGECLPYFKDCKIRQAEVQDVFNTLPGAVDLIPSAEYWQTFNSLDPQHPVPYVDERGFVRSTFADVNAFLRQRGVSDLLLASAALFHRDDATWLAGVKADVSFVQGFGYCTTAQVIDRYRFDKGGVLVHVVDLGMTDGDYRVLPDAAGPLQGAHRNLLFAGYHTGDLVGRPGVSIAVARLQDQDVVTGGSPGRACDAFQLLSPAEMVVSNSGGARTGSDGVVVFSEDPTADFQRVGDDKFVSVNEAGSYTVSVYGTGTGDSVIRVKSSSNGVVTRIITYPLVPTTARSRGSFTVDTAAKTASELAWDTDGDGIIDLRLQPTVLTGVAADDRTPPLIAVDPGLGTRTVAGGIRLSWTASDPESGISKTIALIDPGTPFARSVDHPEVVELSSGTHVVQFNAENGAGSASGETRTINVMPVSILEPTGTGLAAQAGRTIPVKFTVSGPSGAFTEPIATVEIRNATGALILGPIGPAANPADGLAITGRDTYHANISTTGLAPGSYELVIRFSSSTVTGEVRRPLVLR